MSFFHNFFYFLFLNNIFSIKFGFKMSERTMRCLGEFLPDSTTAIFSIEANSKEIRVRLFDPNGNTIFNKVNFLENLYLFRKITTI